MKVLIVLNDPPYGTERSYNGLRLAMTLGRSEGTVVKVFLMGDAAVCAKRGQKTPQGYYNIETMIKAVLSHGGAIGVCGTCMEARGIESAELIEGSHRSTMAELTQWTLDADKVLVF